MLEINRKIENAKKDCQLNSCEKQPDKTGVKNSHRFFF